MYYARYQNTILCAATDDLPGERLAACPAGQPLTWLFTREPGGSRDAFAVTHPGQLCATEETIAWLNANSYGFPAIDPALADAITAGRLRAVNRSHPRWTELLTPQPGKESYRLNLIATGDVGSTLLIVLRLLGSTILSSIGIFDLSPAALFRWEFELNQATAPGLSLPVIEIRSEEDLFDCDLLVFCASRGVPPLTAAGDVRMAQWQGNRRLVEHYARLARCQRFCGLFAVVSDPVDLLSRAVLDASNRDENGRWDGQGLFSEQVEGFGLGVMYARAAYYASRDARFASFAREGAAFGPHGRDLVIANSLTHYDDTLSCELTELAATANLVARANGFKPYVAPALSSAALPLLALLRRQTHLSTTLLGNVFFGATSRRTSAGIALPATPLPPALCARLQTAAEHLAEDYQQA